MSDRMYEQAEREMDLLHKEITTLRAQLAESQADRIELGIKLGVRTAALKSKNKMIDEICDKGIETEGKLAKVTAALDIAIAAIRRPHDVVFPNKLGDKLQAAIEAAKGE